MKRAKITGELAYGNALDRFTGVDKPVVESDTSPAKEPPGSSMIKLSVFLHRDEDAYLESLSSTAKFTGGKKLSKTKLVETMVQAFRTINIDVRGVKTDEELYNRVIAHIR